MLSHLVCNCRLATDRIWYLCPVIDQSTSRDMFFRIFLETWAPLIIIVDNFWVPRIEGNKKKCTHDKNASALKGF